MGNVDLSNSQRQILTVLVNRYQQQGDAIKGTEVASVIDRSPGTVRNQMQSLTSIGLVDGIQGPNGGYEPTAAAFEMLGREVGVDRETVALSRDEARVDVTVGEIQFTNVPHPEECTAHVYFQQTVRDVSVGDPILVGPTPEADLVVGGRVLRVNDTGDQVSVDVSVVRAPLSADEEVTEY